MAHSKKGCLVVGLLRAPVRLEVAVDEDGSSFRTVCTNQGAHEPVRVKAHVDCPSCGKSGRSVWDYPERASESDGKLTLVTADEIKAAKGAPIKDMALTFHPREQVYSHTFAADSVQNVYPERGAEKQYNAILAALSQRPGRVACAVYAPSTANALWVLEVIEGRLVASKRCWPEDVRPAQQIVATEPMSEAEQQFMDVLVDGLTTDFDMTLYRNTAKEGLQKLLAERGVAFEAQLVQGSTGQGGGDMLAALQASVKALQPAPSSRAQTRKPPAKKAAAKKTAVKKTVSTKKTAAKKGVAAA